VVLGGELALLAWRPTSLTGLALFPAGVRTLAARRTPAGLGRRTRLAGGVLFADGGRFVCRRGLALGRPVWAVAIEASLRDGRLVLRARELFVPISPALLLVPVLVLRSGRGLSGGLVLGGLVLVLMAAVQTVQRRVERRAREETLKRVFDRLSEAATAGGR